MRGLSQYQFFFRAFLFVVIMMVAFGTYRTLTNPAPSGSPPQTMPTTEVAVGSEAQRAVNGTAASSTAGRRMALVTLLCFTVLALAMLVVLWRMRTAMRAGMVATEGIVVGAVQYDDGESNLFYPMVEFQTAAGETIRFRGHIGTAFAPPYKVGDRVKVYYHPAQPQSAIIDR